MNPTISEGYCWIVFFSDFSFSSPPPTFRNPVLIKQLFSPPPPPFLQLPYPFFFFEKEKRHFPLPFRLTHMMRRWASERCSIQKTSPPPLFPTLSGCKTKQEKRVFCLAVKHYYSICHTQNTIFIENHKRNVFMFSAYSRGYSPKRFRRKMVLFSFSCVFFFFFVFFCYIYKHSAVYDARSSKQCVITSITFIFISLYFPSGLHNICLNFQKATVCFPFTF